MSADGLTIYGAKFSRAHRCLWAALELGLPFEHADLPFSSPSLKQPDYLSRNAMGKVPAIDDGGFALSESMAINLYLAGKRPNALWPSDPHKQAKILQWTFWVVTEVEPSALPLGFNVGLLPLERRNPELAAQAFQRLQRPMAVLEAALSDPYLLGADFTIADLNVASVMWCAWAGGADIGEFPRVKDWMERCLNRPAVGQAYAMPTW